jgi:hypothetical protein
MIELGDEGNETGDPAEKVEVVELLVMGTSVASQVAFVGFAVAQAVVVAYTVGFAGALLLFTVKVTASCG